MKKKELTLHDLPIMVFRDIASKYDQHETKQIKLSILINCFGGCANKYCIIVNGIVEFEFDDILEATEKYNSL